jgi:hypothetical protein
MGVFVIKKTVHVYYPYTIYVYRATARVNPAKNDITFFKRNTSPPSQQLWFYMYTVAILFHGCSGKLLILFNQTQFNFWKCVSGTCIAVKIFLYYFFLTVKCVKRRTVNIVTMWNKHSWSVWRLYMNINIVQFSEGRIGLDSNIYLCC